MAEPRQRPLHIIDEEAYETDDRRVEATVSERPTWTGLYDANGVPLHRPHEPFGFKPR